MSRLKAVKAKLVDSYCCNMLVMWQQSKFPTCILMFLCPTEYGIGVNCTGKYADFSSAFPLWNMVCTIVLYLCGWWTPRPEFTSPRTSLTHCDEAPSKCLGYASGIRKQWLDPISTLLVMWQTDQVRSPSLSVAAGAVSKHRGAVTVLYPSHSFMKVLLLLRANGIDGVGKVYGNGNMSSGGVSVQAHTIKEAPLATYVACNGQCLNPVINMLWVLPQECNIIHHLQTCCHYFLNSLKRGVSLSW